MTFLVDGVQKTVTPAPGVAVSVAEGQQDRASLLFIHGM